LLLDPQILWDEAGVLWLGREGQDAFGRKNFLELPSVFSAPPMFAVLHGRHELGWVDETTFLGRRDDGPPVLLLAGRAWRVAHLDWKGRRARVEPAEDAGRSRWRCGGQILRHDLCRSIRKVLADDAARPGWSRRAVARLETVRSEYPWLSGDEAHVLLVAGEEAAWWTFAGGRANAALAHELANRLDAKVRSDNFAVRFPRGLGAEAIGLALDGLRGADPGSLAAPASEQAIDGLKFSECLPRDLAARVVRARLADGRGVADALGGAKNE
jgi:ATP-dependent helicase Lhr and Lhr-like helicase